MVYHSKKGLIQEMSAEKIRNSLAQAKKSLSEIEAKLEELLKKERDGTLSTQEKEALKGWMEGVEKAEAELKKSQQKLNR